MLNFKRCVLSFMHRSLITDFSWDVVRHNKQIGIRYKLIRIVLPIRSVVLRRRLLARSEAGIVFSHDIAIQTLLIMSWCGGKSRY